jgi:AraC-like DNA-binding protein
LIPTRWSTENIRGGERFAYWHEAICQTVLNVSMEHRPEQFAAEITARQFGPLRFATFSASRHDVVRTRADIARAADDHALVSLQCAGRSAITQDGNAFTLDPGEIAILDGDRPFRVAFPDRVSRVLALIPRAGLEARAPWLRRNTSHRIAGGQAFLDLARLHLMRLADAGPLNEGEAALLTDNLCNLLALATTRDVAAPVAVPLETILAWCRQHLTEPDLSPASAAAALGISPRTLHLRFRATGQSFGEWLLASRLDLVRKVLIASRAPAATIAEIAFGCGFRDLSHFNRTFRARFGMTPGECRAAAGTDGPI